jgi:hypothetical protein
MMNQIQTNSLKKYRIEFKLDLLKSQIDESNSN